MSGASAAHGQVLIAEAREEFDALRSENGPWLDSTVIDVWFRDELDDLGRASVELWLEDQLLGYVETQAVQFLEDGWLTPRMVPAAKRRLLSDLLGICNRGPARSLESDFRVMGG